MIRIKQDKYKQAVFVYLSFTRQSVALKGFTLKICTRCVLSCNYYFLKHSFEPFVFGSHFRMLAVYFV